MDRAIVARARYRTLISLDGARPTISVLIPARTSISRSAAAAATAHWIVVVAADGDKCQTPSIINEDSAAQQTVIGRSEANFDRTAACKKRHRPTALYDG